MPEGYRIVLRHAMCSTGGQGEHLFAIVAHGIQVYQWRAPAAYASLSLAMNVVLYERETVTCVVYGPDVGFMLSGYIFEDRTGPIGDYLTRSLPARPENKPLDRSP